MSLVHLTESEFYINIEISFTVLLILFGFWNFHDGKKKKK